MWLPLRLILTRNSVPLQASYESSTSSYESYNRFGLTLSLAATNQGPSTGMGDSGIPGSPSGGGLSKSSHDPYRFTRSTSQPVRSPTEPTSPTKYRYCISSLLIHRFLIGTITSTKDSGSYFNGHSALMSKQCCCNE